MKRTQLTLLCSAFLLCFWLALPVSAALVVDFEGSASVVDNIADPFSPGIDITVDFSGVGPVWINFLEFPIGVGPHPLAISIINSTGVPWTDFHVESTGVDIDIDEMLITPLTGAISDFEVIENMVWIFFDPPEFVGIDIMGQHFHPLLVTNFSLHLAPSIPIPAAIWLFGSALGLLGLRRLV